VALYELQMKDGTAAPFSPTRAECIGDFLGPEVLWLRRDIMQRHDISETQMPRVVGRCIAPHCRRAVR